MNRVVIFLPILLFLLGSCRHAEKKITNVQDYEIYLKLDSDKKMAAIDEELNFWKSRLHNYPDDIVPRSKMASLLSRRFEHSGEIHELHQADSLYQLVLPLNKKNSSGTYRSLASICISLHKFREAELYLDSATNLGDDQYLTLLMVFDVAMELGNYPRAEQVLTTLRNDHSFELLIRRSKFKDHAEGKQAEAILLLEEAYEKIRGRGNQELEIWVKSNLGDMYSHANRLKEAYQSYLDVLSIDPFYYHALKGIGWLAYSNDKDFNNSKRIFESLLRRHPSPDYLLLLGQISGLQNRHKEEEYYYKRFIKEAIDPRYGDMYNKYLFSLQSDVLKDYDGALRLAQREVSIRPTPQSYNLLAWAYFKKGNTKEALAISRVSVENRCFEPDALYRTGMINLSVNKGKAKKFLMLAKKSQAELGPSISQEIDKAIRSL